VQHTHSRTHAPHAHAQLFTRDGEISLSARSTHYMWRDEAQPLIAEGVLTKVSDE
jgi:GINS complex subunit 1